MANLIISGETNPEIGKDIFYSIFPVGLDKTIANPLSPISTQPAHWEIYVLEKRKWRKTTQNAKTGDTVSYNFNQKSLVREGIKLVVTRGNDKGELHIKTKRAGKPKVKKVELFDRNYHKISKPLNYTDTIIAKAYCDEMEGETVLFTLWEDDAVGSGHNKINEMNKINPIPLRKDVVDGVAEVRFNMALYTQAARIADMQVAKGDKNEGKNHEYYVTVDYYGKMVGESKNVNIQNPNYDNPIQRALELQYPEKFPPKPKEPNKRPTPSPEKPKKDAFKAPITAKAKTKAPDPKGKILSAEFVDGNQKPFANMKFGTSVYAKVRTNGLKGKTVILKIFEDDLGTNQRVYMESHTLPGDVSLIPIKLSQKMRADGDNLPEGNEQEYFLQIEYAGQSVTSSLVNVNDDSPKIKMETGASTVGVKKQELQSNKEVCFCHKTFDQADVRRLVKMFKGSETIWEGQALKGGRRATCNIDDKSFTALTNALNSAFENYKIKTCAQKMHFLAQALTETGTFSSSEETASQHASSQSVYKGRGVLQLTGTQDGSKLYNNPGPYEKYADYKVNHDIVKHPNIISNNINYCIDSGGWIWSHGKKMPEAPSGAVDRWGLETSGKSLNELAVFGDKYLELISVLLNGRGKDNMPNGWKERKANYNLLKTGFFKYDWYHNDNSKKLNAEDIITYHIYSEGRIERHIPKKIKSDYETKYRYIYHDKNDKEHIICIVDWLEINKVKRSKPNPSSIPSGYISHESFNISGVNQKNVYKYSDGSVIASGKAGEGSSTIIRKYTKISGKEIIVKIPDPLNYSSGNLKINLIFKDTIRKYMGRDHFACLIGALAECNFNQVISGGAAMKDGTCFPSVSHTNGTSIDIAYFSHANTQIFINAMIKFGFNYFLSGVGMNYIKPSNFNGTLEAGHSDHNHHLHTGAPNSLNIKITEIKE
ncbi:hypothetical protein [Chryseobacterium sp.]|uniref:hypothetical protein n=1 Tax=Chryseobacterium sp. TaxID=1871047 RepID=UPI002896FD6A|nr:hypothetical protein [Chryseobacterium sp.]